MAASEKKSSGRDLPTCWEILECPVNPLPIPGLVINSFSSTAGKIVAGFGAWIAAPILDNQKANSSGGEKKGQRYNSPGLSNSAAERFPTASKRFCPSLRYSRLRIPGGRSPSPRKRLESGKNDHLRFETH